MSNSQQDLRPGRSIDVKAWLADHAQIADGKVFASGAGWTDIRGAAPFAIALMFEVPIEETGKPHKLEIDLIDADGRPALAPTPQGMQPVHMEGDLRVDADENTLEGATSVVTPFVLKQGPMPLAPANYEWRWSVDGETRDHWRLPFRVHEALAA